MFHTKKDRRRWCLSTDNHFIMPRGQSGRQPPQGPRSPVHVSRNQTLKPWREKRKNRTDTTLWNKVYLSRLINRGNNAGRKITGISKGSIDSKVATWTDHSRWDDRQVLTVLPFGSSVCNVVFIAVFFVQWSGALVSWSLVRIYNFL